MKNKLMLAAVIGLLSTGAIFAFGRRNGDCCPQRRSRACRPKRRNNDCCPKRNNCPPRCKRRSRVVSEPTPPRCCKTIMVDKTIQVPKVIEVPARKIVTPQPDLIEYIPQEPVEVRIPQPATIIENPDIIEYRCQPDKVVHHKQPDCIRFECPVDCD